MEKRHRILPCGLQAASCASCRQARSNLHLANAPAVLEQASKKQDLGQHRSATLEVDRLSEESGRNRKGGPGMNSQTYWLFNTDETEDEGEGAYQKMIDHSCI